jgi:hypothetical protein
VSAVRKAEEAVLSAAFGLDRGGKRGPGSHVSITVESWTHLQHTIVELRAAAADEAPRIFGCGCSALKVKAGRCDVYGPDGKPRSVDMATGGTASIRAMSLEIEGDADAVKASLDAALEALEGEPRFVPQRLLPPVKP